MSIYNNNDTDKDKDNENDKEIKTFDKWDKLDNIKDDLLRGIYMFRLR